MIYAIDIPYFMLKVRKGVAVVVYFYHGTHTDKFDIAGRIHIYLAMRLASGVLGIRGDTNGMANLWRTTAL